MQLILPEQFNTAADHLPMTAFAVIELLTEWVHPGQLSLWLTNLSSPLHLVKVLLQLQP